MKTRELQAKTEGELSSELLRLRKELQEMGPKLRMGQIKNVRQMKVLRKEIARIFTHIRTRLSTID